MTEENKPESNVKSTIDAVTGLAKAVPVYQDAVQPAAQQIGKSLETVTKLVNIALVPIKVMVWGYDQIEEFITRRVSEKLKNVPEENIITPAPEVAGPAVEALRFAGQSEDLRELYANLIANAMDSSTARDAHPAFVEMLKNLKPDEARILQEFVDKPTSANGIAAIQLREEFATGGYKTLFPILTHLHSKYGVPARSVPALIDNLCRLGILEVPYGLHFSDHSDYETLMSHTDLEDLKKEMKDEGRTLAFEKLIVRPTQFGRVFIECVVSEKGSGK